MGLMQVLADDVAGALFDSLFFANYFDSTATGASCGLHDVHALITVHLSVNQPPLVILGENIGCRRNVKCFAIDSPHSLNILPHKVLSSDAPAASKVIRSLEFVYVLYSVYFEKSGPQQVPVAAGSVTEAGHFETIDHTVVSVS